MKGLIGKIIWDLSEFLGIGLGRFAKPVFDMVMGQKERLIK